MNQKNTTKATMDKTPEKKAPEKTSVVVQPDAPAKTYTTFSGMLTAKARKALPRGTKANVIGDKIIFAAKGVEIAKLSIHDFVSAELKRNGFQLAD